MLNCNSFIVTYTTRKPVSPTEQAVFPLRPEYRSPQTASLVAGIVQHADGRDQPQPLTSVAGSRCHGGCAPEAQPAIVFARRCISNHAEREHAHTDSQRGVRLLQIRSVLSLWGRGPCAHLTWTFAGSILVLHGLAASSQWPSAGCLAMHKRTVFCRNIQRYWILRRICRSISCSASTVVENSVGKSVPFMMVVKVRLP